jgi:hypothetical protein
LIDDPTPQPRPPRRCGVGPFLWRRRDRCYSSGMRLLLLLATGVIGCGGTFVTMTPVNLPPHPMVPRSPESVEIFTSGPPAAPHVDVALLEVEQTHSYNEQGTDLMIRRLREVAAAHGCDAVSLGGVSEHAGAPKGTALALVDRDATTRQATCIVYGTPPTATQENTAANTVKVTPPEASTPSKARSKLEAP